jgi:hypothetical protein
LFDTRHAFSHAFRIRRFKLQIIIVLLIGQNHRTLITHR